MSWAIDIPWDPFERRNIEHSSFRFEITNSSNLRRKREYRWAKLAKKRHFFQNRTRRNIKEIFNFDQLWSTSIVKESAYKYYENYEQSIRYIKICIDIYYLSFHKILFIIYIHISGSRSKSPDSISQKFLLLDKIVAINWNTTSRARYAIGQIWKQSSRPFPTRFPIAPLSLPLYIHPHRDGIP